MVLKCQVKSISQTFAEKLVSIRKVSQCKNVSVIPVSSFSGLSLFINCPIASSRSRSSDSNNSKSCDC